MLEAHAEGSSLNVLVVGKLAFDQIPLIQDLLDCEVLQAPSREETCAASRRL